MKLRWLLGVLAWIAGGQVPAFAAGAEVLQARIEQLELALATVRLEGDLVHFDGAALASFTLVPASATGASGTQRSELRSLDLPAPAQARDGVGQAVVTPGVRVAAAFPVSGLRRALRWYTLADCAPRLIAGRDTRCVQVQPADRHRPGYTLWLDAQYGAVLGVNIHDPEGIPLEYMQFSRVTFTTFTEAAGDAGGAPPSSGPSLPAAGGDWLPRWVPDGFELVGYSGAGPDRSCSYSDGVTRFSIFAGPLGPGDGLDTGQGSESVVGASVVVERVVRRTGGADERVVLAGELPLATARRILLGVLAPDA